MFGHRSTAFSRTAIGIAVGAGLCLVGAGTSWSEDEGPGSTKSVKERASKESSPETASKEELDRLTTRTTSPAGFRRNDGPLYALPQVGKPRGRVGGGRRSAGAALPEVYALVPDHVGQTASEQPVLYWYLSSDAPATVKFELTLLDEESIDPLVDAKIESPERSGLQRVVLEDHGIRLTPGEEYQWSVAIVSDDENRSDDVVSSGWVERVSIAEEVSAAAAAASDADRVWVYGQAGLWYDALDAAYLEMMENPGDPKARAQFERLLSEAELPIPVMASK